MLLSHKMIWIFESFGDARHGGCGGTRRVRNGLSSESRGVAARWVRWRGGVMHPCEGVRVHLPRAGGRITEPRGVAHVAMRGA